MKRPLSCISLCLAALWLCACPAKRTGGEARPSVSVEVFVVSPAGSGDLLRYVRRISALPDSATDPDTTARELAAGFGEPSLLHSTSWRWEKDGAVVLTYLAYCERAVFEGVQPSELRWDDLVRPSATDPLHPRPPEIREIDVLSHGLRHLSFLIRYARDDRVAAALSPASLKLFQGVCGQLAGRLESARDFEECAAVGRR
jgi:hypothetical protein